MVWISTDTNRNYGTPEAAKEGLGGDSDQIYGVTVRMPCPTGWERVNPNGYVLRKCDDWGNWRAANYGECPSNPCSKDKIDNLFPSERNINLAATKATCSVEECTVTCKEGMTPNIDKLTCFGGDWIPKEAACSENPVPITVETEAPYVEYDPDSVPSKVHGTDAPEGENTGSSSGALLVGVGALIAVLAGVGYMYQKKGAAPEKSGSFMTDERKTRSGRRKKGAQE